jgi:hypothetical protein
MERIELYPFAVDHVDGAGSIHRDASRPVHLWRTRHHGQASAGVDFQHQRERLVSEEDVALAIQGLGAPILACTAGPPSPSNLESRPAIVVIVGWPVHRQATAAHVTGVFAVWLMAFLLGCSRTGLERDVRRRHLDRVCGYGNRTRMIVPPRVATKTSLVAAFSAMPVGRERLSTSVRSAPFV